MDSRILFIVCLVAALLAAAACITLTPAPARIGPAPPIPSLRPDTPGTLTITSSPPGAEVWLDSDPGPSTTTPVTLTLSPITHPVMLRLAWYRVYVTSVKVLPGAEAMLAVVMEPGS